MAKQFIIISAIVILFIVSLGVLFAHPGTFRLFFDRSPQQLQPYNVIMISIDTLRADHMGVYGYSRNTSPNLDRFAEESIMFEQAISQSTWTLPSHMSLFTSQYPSVHGVMDWESQLPQSKITLAEVFKQQGYETAAFVAGGGMSAYFGYSGFDIYRDNAENFSFTDTLPAAVEWLKQNKDQRFFLFVHGYDVHGPYYSPESFDHMFDAGYEGTLRDHEKFFLQTGSSDSRSILQYIKIVEDKLVLALEEETIDFNDYFFFYYAG